MTDSQKFLSVVFKTVSPHELLNKRPRLVSYLCNTFSISGEEATLEVNTFIHKRAEKLFTDLHTQVSRSMRVLKLAKE